MAIDAALIIIAVAHAHFAGETGVRLGGDDADHTHGGGGTEQGGLRALHHFDAFQIIKIEVGTTRPRDIDAVEIDGDGRRALRGAGVRCDAADHEAGVVGRLFLHVQAGHIGGKLIELCNADLAQATPGVGGDGDRHVVQFLLGLLRRHHDFLADRFGHLIGFGGKGRQGRQQAGGSEQQKTAHIIPHVGGTAMLQCGMKRRCAGCRLQRRGSGVTMMLQRLATW